MRKLTLAAVVALSAAAGAAGTSLVETRSSAAQAEREPRGSLEWEIIDVGVNESTSRARVPGGWLVLAKARAGTGLTFVPDPDGEWKAE